MTNLDSVLKSRDVTLPKKARLVKAMVFPVVMYGCESWTVKKAERQRINASELWCWRRLLKVPWTARRSSQSTLKEISPEYSLEGLMLKLKLQYFGHLMLTHWERSWCWERLKVGGAGDDRGWDSWMASLTQWTWVWVNSRSWWWTQKPGMLQSMGSQRVKRDWATELNWTEFPPFHLPPAHLKGNSDPGWCGKKTRLPFPSAPYQTLQYLTMRDRPPAFFKPLQLQAEEAKFLVSVAEK